MCVFIFHSSPDALFMNKCGFGDACQSIWKFIKRGAKDDSNIYRNERTNSNPQNHSDEGIEQKCAYYVSKILSKSYKNLSTSLGVVFNA